jgi:hypothetical protein
VKRGEERQRERGKEEKRVNRKKWRRREVHISELEMNPFTSTRAYLNKHRHLDVY